MIDPRPVANACLNDGAEITPLVAVARPRCGAGETHRLLDMFMHRMELAPSP
jgi:hypothetical protein